MRSIRIGGLAAILAVTLAALGAVGGVSAAGNTMKLDPATTTVAKDGTLTVKVIQDASVATSGAQATITFDKAKLQVTKIDKGAPYASATLFLAADAAAISAANKSGKLKTVAAAFLPPGNVPAGAAEFIIVTFKATACGTAKLGLPVGAGDAAMNDGRDAKYGAALKVTTTGASVTVACDGAAVPPPAAPSGAVPSDAVPSGDVAGATGTLEAGTSGDPAAQPSEDPSLPPLAPVSAAGPLPSAVVMTAAGSDPGTQNAAQQDAWLTFAMAALGIAAIGLALMIVVVVAALLIGAIAGLIFLVRLYRRPTDTPPGGAAGDAPGGDVPDAGASDAYAEPVRAPVGSADPTSPAGAGPGQPGPGAHDPADR